MCRFAPFEPDLGYGEVHQELPDTGERRAEIDWKKGSGKGIPEPFYINFCIGSYYLYIFIEAQIVLKWS